MTEFTQRRDVKNGVRVVYGAAFMLLGINHFASARFYVAIMPPYLPLHWELVYLSGIFEILFGAMLVLNFKIALAAWGLIALLIAVYPANIHMALNPQSYPDIPAWLLYARLPFQFLFIGIAYWLTRSK